MTELSLSYPIGKFKAPENYNPETVAGFIDRIEALPQKIRQAVEGLNDNQLDTAYRPDGWTVRQVVNHLADSHMNAFIRIKLGLTEKNPNITAYDEKAWAELVDSKGIAIQSSVLLLEGLHQRWGVLLRSLNQDQLQRTFNHPVSGANPLNRAIGLYAWHGDHHLAHITSLKSRNNW